MLGETVSKLMPQTKGRDILFFLFTVALICSGFAFSEMFFNFGAFSEGRYSGFLYWPCILIVLGVYAAMFFISAKRYGVKISMPLLIGGASLFLINAIATLSFTGAYDAGELMYQASVGIKFRLIASELVSILSLYLAFAVMPKIIRKQTLLRLIWYVVIVLAGVSIIYSAIAEFDLYKEIVKNMSFSSAYETPKSFTDNHNVFARILFFGIIACAFLQSTSKPRWWRWALISAFFTFEAFTLSKATFGITAIFLIAFGLIRFFKTLKRHKIRNLITMGIVVFFGVFCILTKFIPGLTKIYSFIENTWKVVVDALSDASDIRVYIWSASMRFQFADPLKVIFGVGFGIDKGVLLTFKELYTGGTVPLDGDYVLTLFRHGILGCIVYLAFLAYLVYRLVVCFKNRSADSFVLALSLFSILLLSLFESCGFFGTSRINAFSIFLAVSILISASDKEEIPQKEIAYETEGAFSHKLAMYILLSFSFAITAFVSIGFNAGLLNAETSLKWLVSLSVLGLVCPLCSEGIMTAFRKTTKHGVLFSLAALIYLASAFTMPLISDHGLLFVLISAILGFALLSALVVTYRQSGFFVHSIKNTPIYGAYLLCIIFGYMIVAAEPSLWHVIPYALASNIMLWLSLVAYIPEGWTLSHSWDLADGKINAAIDRYQAFIDRNAGMDKKGGKAQ